VDYNKKPTAVASRGFLSKLSSASTVPGGIAGYQRDDYDYQDLLNLSNHDPHRSQPAATGQAPNHLVLHCLDFCS
jgi:hypothetical protein